MNDPKRTIFNDRRDKSNRRQQNLPMPSGLDRRAQCRRSRRFHANPWWLSINYAEELVSEQTVIDSEATAHTPVRPLQKKKQD